jgi:hypothetical protein
MSWMFLFAPERLPQRIPSDMAVMLNVTDVADGFPFTPKALFPFSPVQSDPYARSILCSLLAR